MDALEIRPMSIKIPITVKRIRATKLAKTILKNPFMMVLFNY
jgi:hypothetical protein